MPIREMGITGALALTATENAPFCWAKQGGKCEISSV